MGSQSDYVSCGAEPGRRVRNPLRGGQKTTRQSRNDCQPLATIHDPARHCVAGRASRQGMAPNHLLHIGGRTTIYFLLSEMLVSGC